MDGGQSFPTVHSMPFDLAIGSPNIAFTGGLCVVFLFSKNTEKTAFLVRKPKPCLCELCPDGSEGRLCCRYRRWTPMINKSQCFTLTPQFLETAVNRNCLLLFILREYRCQVEDVTPR